MIADRRNVRFMSGLTIALCLGVPGLFAFQNCDNVKLHLHEKSVEIQKVTRLCAQQPPNFQEMHRFLFFIDNSQSMQGLDPSIPLAPPVVVNGVPILEPANVGKTRRVNALRNFIDQYRTDDNFSIAVGGLHNRAAGYLPDPAPPVLPNVPPDPPNAARGQAACSFLKPRVPADYVELQKAADQLDIQSALAFGNSPFMNVMDSFEQCLDADLNASNGALYSLVFVTDAAPTDTTLVELQERATRLINKGKATGERFSRINLFLLYLDNFNTSPEASNIVHQTIKAAQEAGGLKSKAIMIDPSKDFDYSALGLYDAPRYKLKQILVTNMNSAIETDGMLGPDSDADGISDKREIQLGLDPLKASTNGVCSDLIYIRNQNRCPSTCPEGLKYLDSDHDGISDCDESILGTNATNADTDGDGLLDGSEHYLGLSPIDPTDRDSDPDGDGANNEQELSRGTSPFFDDRTVNHKMFIDVSKNEIVEADGSYCYDVTLTGLQVFETQEVQTNTLAYLNHRNDENIIRVLFLEVPENQPSARPLILEAYRTMIYRKSQNGGIYRSINDLTDDDFSFVER